MPLNDHAGKGISVYTRYCIQTLSPDQVNKFHKIAWSTGHYFYSSMNDSKYEFLDQISGKYTSSVLTKSMHLFNEFQLLEGDFDSL